MGNNLSYRIYSELGLNLSSSPYLLAYVFLEDLIMCLNEDGIKVINEENVSIPEEFCNTFNSLVKFIFQGLRLLYKNEIDLFECPEGNERVFVSHLACCFLRVREKDNHPIVDGLSIDCEYGKQGGSSGEGKFKSKRIGHGTSQERGEKGELIIPDIIIHKRKDNNNNMLVIECKRSNSKESAYEHDFKKLSALTSLTGDFRYKLGVHLKFFNETKSQLIFFYDSKRVASADFINNV